MSTEKTKTAHAEKTSLTCPDCAGALDRITEGPLQYRCRVGHTYSPETALVAHRERRENTLWSALVLLEEGAELAEEIIELTPLPDSEKTILQREAKVSRELAEQIRAVVNEMTALAPSE